MKTGEYYALQVAVHDGIIFIRTFGYMRVDSVVLITGYGRFDISNRLLLDLRDNSCPFSAMRCQDGSLYVRRGS